MFLISENLKHDDMTYSFFTWHILDSSEYKLHGKLIMK